jgi:hypothetical protein
MKHYTPENFSLTQSVGFLLTKARNLITTEMDTALKDLDITGPQMGILLAMTRMLDKLETKGLLERSRSVDDRRVVNLELTKKGEAIAGEIPAVAPEVLNVRLKKFTKAEFDELCRLLNKFIGE